jgi:hypothetical protein
MRHRNPRTVYSFSYKCRAIDKMATSNPNQETHMQHKNRRNIKVQNSRTLQEGELLSTMKQSRNYP